MLKYKKWIGGSFKWEAKDFLSKAGFHCRTVDTSQETELLKLLSLAKYGTYLAFAQYQKNIGKQYGVTYEHILAWDLDYNNYVESNLKRPIFMQTPGNHIGGHCVIPGTKTLNKQHPNQMLEEVLKYE